MMTSYRSLVPHVHSRLNLLPAIVRDKPIPLVLVARKRKINTYSREFYWRSTARYMSTASVVSSKNKDPTTLDDPNPSSARKQFKNIPVHPSILEYIRSIGIGIPRRTLGSKKNRLFNDPAMLDQRRPRGRRNRLSPEKASNGAPSSQGQSFGNSNASAGVPWLPPPPFGPKSSPVQVIASVGPESVLVPERSDLDLIVPKSPFPKNQSLISEVALAGRSNVGKSTLLNALLYGNRDINAVQQRRQRGRVPPNVKLPPGCKASMSDRPGETRQVTFYQLQHIAVIDSTKEIESHKLILVDLPGYGFAYAKESHSAAFRTLLSDYILNRGKVLKRVLLLIDARHGMKKADFDFLETLQVQSSVAVQLPPIQIVLTKCDLVEQADLARRVAQVRQQLSDSLRREPSQLPIMLVSAKPGVGYNNVDRRENRARGGVLELQKELAALALPRRSKAKQIPNDNKTNLTL